MFQKVAADKGAVAKAPAVVGTFAHSQGVPASVDTIARVMGTPRYVCSSTYAGTPQSLNVLDWTIEVGGAVENEFVATVGDLAENGPMNIVMGCSCASNPADGVASVDADVSGVMSRFIVDVANPDAGVNTVVFTSAHGYEAALSLRYLDQRYPLIVFDVNGQPLSDSMGGSNQLWLSGTSANSRALCGRSAPQSPPGSRGRGRLPAMARNHRNQDIGRVLWQEIELIRMSAEQYGKKSSVSGFPGAPGGRKWHETSQIRKFARHLGWSATIGSLIPRVSCHSVSWAS